MKYRKFGKTNIELSVLGFGSMRLPVIDNNQANINESEAIRMMHYAFDNGINYIDTAYPYHEGQSELVVGKALKHRYRDKIHLATKLPSWAIESYSDFDKYLDEQLAKLQTDHIDFYLIHNLHANVWPKIRDLGVLNWCDNIIKSGKVRYVGFSIHDTAILFKEILDSYNWDFCQIQYNYMNEDIQVGTKGIEYAYQKEIPVIIMEPLLGGSLVQLPTQIKQLFDNAGKDHINMALQWLWNKKEVSLVLSGMSSMEQLVKNIEYASKASINSFSAKDYDLMEKIKNEYSKLVPIPCTKCRYCLPCPKNIEIPHLFGLYNDAVVHKDKSQWLYRVIYNNNIPEDRRADACIKCRKCEAKCPQGIKIANWMPKVHSELYEP
ncbi:MAG TPA: aldo/keto reductase [Lentisphaeria bacterium]|nr:MAG: aldo/keto reductase [Lentisphaerae bacterium GWF2_38_69]HBM17567.1 aldo/keto reductase [Lentisphaeria bacterium]